MAMHDDELPIDAALVRSLVAAQFPAWADLPVTAVGGPGTVHAVFRIGDELSGRFPRRADDPERVRARHEAEAQAARELAQHLPVAVPEPVAIGEPGPGYPLPWAVHRWIPGDTADAFETSDSAALARDLAEVVGVLRSIPTRGRTFGGVGRGGHLPDHDGWMASCFARSEQLLPVDRLRRLWAELRTLPRHDDDVMTHGDLIPANLIVDRGRLRGLLDVGGYSAADPALDLVVAWHLFDDDARAAFRERLEVDELGWRRGMGWAFQQAMGLVWYYEVTNPPMSELGRRTLGRLLAASEGRAPAACSEP